MLQCEARAQTIVFDYLIYINTFRAHSSTVEQLPLKESVGGSNPSALTILEIVETVEAELAAPASADSAA